MYKLLSGWPTYSRDPDDILKLYGKSPLGIDLEWNAKEQPTILGLSDGQLNISVLFDDGLPYLIELLNKYPETKWVGHNVVGADLYVLRKLGINLPLENMEDTILWHYLVNPHLCKSKGKSSLEEDGGDRRGRGFMNLGSFSSIYTDLPYWKACRGDGKAKERPTICEGNPCPAHDEFWYNSCMYTDTKVWMADNTWKAIQEIEAGEEVFTVKKGKLVTRKVLRRTKRTGDVKWVAVSSWGEHMANHKGLGVICTHDHKWFTLNRGWIEAENLTTEDRVFLPRAGHASLVHGTILGDAFVSEKGHISVGQSNFAWAKAKEICLQGNLLTIEAPDFWNQTKIRTIYNFTKAVGIHWRTLFYQGRQKLWVPPPDAAALAVFYADDGCLSRQGWLRADDTLSISYNARFACHAFEDKETVKQWFQEKYGKTGIGNRAVVILSKIAATAFFKEIAPWLHPSMEYKLPPEYRGKYNGWMEELVPQMGQIRSVKPALLPRKGKTKTTQWCLEVEDAHAFFTRAGLVKNCDSLSCVLALPKVKRIATLRGVDKLYPMHRELMLALAEMRDAGVRIDVPYVNTLRKEFEEEKEELGKTLPFNPDSAKQVMDWFNKGKKLETDAGGFATLENNQEETVREMVERLGDDNSPDELIALLDYKELGNGPDRWFQPYYRDKNGWIKGFMDDEGYVHPSQGIFTSSARMMCTGPNLQNVMKRRRSRKVCECGHGRERHAAKCQDCQCQAFSGYPIGKKVRRAIIAPEGMYIVRADYSNAENRNYLYLAGYPPPEGDLHQWMVGNIGLKETDEFSLKLGGAREASKTVIHACMTGDHEVLTPNGWIRIEDYQNEKILEWADGGALTFRKPESFFEHSVAENLVSLESHSISALVTENHTFPVAVKGTWQGIYYNKLHKLSPANFLRSGHIPIGGWFDAENDQPLSDLEIQQGIAIQADGSRISSRSAIFHLVKKRKQERLHELFGIEGKPCGCHPTGKRYIVPINSRIIGLGNEGKCSRDFWRKNKSFNSKVLWMSERQRVLFLEEILLWDGSIRKGQSTSRVYSNTDLVSIQWAQTIAHLTGKEGLVRLNSSADDIRKACWRLSFNRRQYARVNRILEKRVPFEGKVYCFKTRSGYFLVRRDNKIFVSGNSDYGEGLQLKAPEDLRKPRVKKEIDEGARLVFPEWKFKGKVVTFTGINLARRVFGDASFSNRKKANEISSRYIDKTFPKMRDLQKRIFKQVEDENVVRPPHGYTLLSFGNDEDRLKTALAVWGSQPVGHFLKLAILRARRAHQGGRPQRVCLGVHDELLTYTEAAVGPGEGMGWLRETMEGVTTVEMPGFHIPASVSYGPNWRDTKKA